MTKAAKALQASASKRAILIANEKGGVGKTAWAISFVDIMRQDGVPVAAYDADGGVGGLGRLLGTRSEAGDRTAQQDPLVGVGFYNGRSERERDMLVNSIDEGHPLMVHDLAGGLLTDLTRILDAEKNLDEFLATFEDNGYRLTFVHVISNVIAASQSVGRYLKLVGDRADHVAVINRNFGKMNDDFPFWYGFVDPQGKEIGGKTRSEFLALGGVEIEFPALPAGTWAKLDALAIPFTQARGHTSLTLVERGQVQKFMREFRQSLEPARSVLGLAH
ncbi:hypothetical protein JKG68_23585 [Microvirga aerilata]|jgi:hypothetical protein|uniref:CobQ/CobB/MinD/ParA nucleotide binding domain-containing protein n=1 Tax=Microvirga aerilata TaxID=670292 RepID=A0A936ZBI5_9HYPH|nr:division plane positioning ATPase MipZ [Microvirga aerilata]MBL0406927.1 hypothetical protein [Microvirga aerilata]